MSSNEWPQDHVDALKAQAGKSVHEMLDVMRKLRPGMTRNAIVGACARRGIPIGQGQSTAQRSAGGRAARQRLLANGIVDKKLNHKGQPYRVAVLMKPKAYVARAGAWEPVEPIEPIPLERRTSMRCAWPIGEPARPADQLFCGATCVDDKLPYCAAHRRLRLARYVPTELAEAEKIAA